MDPAAIGQLDPFAALGAALGSMALGVVKKHTGILDSKIGRALRPVQPFAVLAASIGLPFATQALGIGAVDPATFVSAPLSTLAVVSARETYRRARGK